MFFFHLYGSGDSAKILKRSKQPPFPLRFSLSPSAWIAVLSSGGGWSLCGAHGDPLPVARLDAPQGRRTLRSSPGWAEGWNCVLSSFLSGSYLLWALRRGWVGFGLGCMWILMDQVEMFFFLHSSRFFLRVYLLGECDGVNDEVMDLICKSLWILGADLRKRLACLYGAAEKEERREEERMKPCKHHRRRSTCISLQLGSEGSPCCMVLITTQCLSAFE